MNFEISEENNYNKEIRKTGKGFGLGIRVSEALAKKTGVKIKMKSSPDQGTSVFIDMPRKAREPKV